MTFPFDFAVPSHLNVVLKHIFWRDVQKNNIHTKIVFAYRTLLEYVNYLLVSHERYLCIDV